MWAAPVHVVSGGAPVSDVRSLLAGVDDDSQVVVHRMADGRDLFYAFEAWALTSALRAAGEAVPLEDALRLSGWPESPTVQLADADTARVGDVVLLGRTAVGVVQAPEQVRGGVAPPHHGGGRPTRGGGGVLAPDDGPFERGGGWREEFPQSAGGEPDVVVDAGVDRPAAGPVPGRRFRAFPALSAPGTVPAGQEFVLRAGFTRTPAVPGDNPVIIPNAAPQFPMVVQVSGGFGFSFPDGIRRELTVDRDAPERASAEFRVVADPVRGPMPRSLEVSYEYLGNLCGQAWHDLVVTETAPAQPAVAAPPRSGGTGLVIADPDAAPHLTVQLNSRPGDPELEFSFSSRYPDLPRPAQRVTRRLERGSAEAFAVQLMAQLPAQVGAAAAWEVMRGVGRVVADALPREFWDALDFVWRRAREDGETPAVLLVTAEQFVPWELAWVEERHVDPGLLPPADTCRALGAVCRVGRWVPPLTRDREGDRPGQPPERVVPVGGMAVVIGDYSGDDFSLNLPEAVAEGRNLALAYAAVEVSVTEQDVTALLDGTLRRDGTPVRPAVLHVAGHGQSNPDQQEYTGIVLRGGRRLDAFTVRGSDLPGLSRPFVFLNACEVGTAGDMLSTYAGLAAAFLAQGCRGFVAPLWKVGDAAAKQVALDFYRSALGQRVPVGEVVRQIRAGFRPDRASPVPMAYVFYGHPQLELQQT